MSIIGNKNINMEAIQMIEERRSVRKYKNEKVDRKLLEEIVSISRWAPSWANYQIARYTIIENENVIKQIASQGVKGFTYNIKTLENAKGVVVLSYIKGKSGKLGDKVKAEDASASETSVWEMFDAGIACQTFCLAAHAKGVGTCIFGVIDADEISKIVSLPNEETVAAIITFGYPDEEPKATPRHSVDQIMRFV